MLKIAPSFLSADFTRIREELLAIETAGADWLHMDVMDGHFVPNLTFGTPVIKQIAKHTGLPLDVHLMVTNPQDYISELADCGVHAVSFHQETVFHIHRLIYQIKEKGMLAGIALNPATPVFSIANVLADVDFVLLMSVNPGFGGQKFLPLVYRKLQLLQMVMKETGATPLIQVDGGVTSENAGQLIQHGTDILVAGSYVFQGPDYGTQIRSLRACSEI